MRNKPVGVAWGCHNLGERGERRTVIHSSCEKSKRERYHRMNAKPGSSRRSFCTFQRVPQTPRATLGAVLRATFRCGGSPPAGLRTRYKFGRRVSLSATVHLL